MKVSLYPGCTAHSTGVEYSESMHAVFDALGVEFLEVDDWNCCGGAAAHCLSSFLGLALPARNIAKAQARDLPLAVPCPGCFNAVKRAQYALTNDPEMRQTLEEIVGFKYKGDIEVKAMHDVVLDVFGEPDGACFVERNFLHCRQHPGLECRTAEVRDAQRQRR